MRSKNFVCSLPKLSSDFLTLTERKVKESKMYYIQKYFILYLLSHKEEYFYMSKIECCQKMNVFKKKKKKKKFFLTWEFFTCKEFNHLGKTATYNS